MRNLPKLVSKITHAHDAWVVGSAANPKNISPRDYDILVPFREWQRAASLIPINAKPNTFGGFKCKSEGYEIDIWPGDLDWILQRPKTIFVWHPLSDTRFVKYGNK